MKALVATSLEEIRAKEDALVAERVKVQQLEKEKEMLLSTVMEMSLYMAEQDARIVTQENAVMELSMLVATTLGGGEGVV